MRHQVAPTHLLIGRATVLLNYRPANPTNSVGEQAMKNTTPGGAEPADVVIVHRSTFSTISRLQVLRAPSPQVSHSGCSFARTDTRESQPSGSPPTPGAETMTSTQSRTVAASAQ